jgi:hypothetical protein
MDLPGQKAAVNKLTVNELRELPRDEIENLVATGLLEADRAAEIQSENNQRQQERQQAIGVQHALAQGKKDGEKKDEEWLKSMSASYQKAYGQLMDTYDSAEAEYGTIKTRAEKLRDRLREKAETAYQFGVPLPNGKLAFYDRGNAEFVDGTSLQPLRGEDTRAAADGFKQLSYRDQQANAGYVDARRASVDAENIVHSADTGAAAIERDKTALQDSQGSVSEEALKKAKKGVDAQVGGLSERLKNAENVDANLDAALSDDADADVAPKRPASDASGPARPISFANLVAPDVLGDGIGKTASSFNAAANPAAPPAKEIIPVPVTRRPLVPSL